MIILLLDCFHPLDQGVLLLGGELLLTQSPVLLRIDLTLRALPACPPAATVCATMSDGYRLSQ